MQKKNLRSIYVKRRKGLTTEKLSDLSLNIANKLLQLPIWEFDNYHIFLPIIEKKEIDTSLILSILQGKDKNIIIPKMNANEGSLSHYLLTDNTKLVKNQWNVPEPVGGLEIAPEDLDVIFVPLMAFDQQGNRVGYGKGYYDRFLAVCKPKAIKIGLSVFEAEEQIGDVDENDIPLDFCVTPEKIYSFDAS